MLQEQPLSYFSPAHGAWNLAHICRLLPESHALFITPPGCSRIILLSAAEQGMQERFSTLQVSENALIAGGLEEEIYRAAVEILQLRRPRALFLVTSCVADFVGLDREAYLSRLETDFPDTVFLDGRMDPINRKSGLPPIVRMQNLLASVLERTQADRAVNFLGSFTPTEPQQELVLHLAAHGFGARHFYRCATLAEARAMGNSALNIVLHPTALGAARALEQRLGIPFVDLSAPAEAGALEQRYAEICAVLSLPEPELREARSACRTALAELRSALANRSLFLDDGFTHLPLALAEAFLENGLPLRRIFLDEGAQAPCLQTPLGRRIAVQVEILGYEAPETARLFARQTLREPTAVCTGEYAAYAAQSRHYLHGLRFSGRFGYAGLAQTARELTRAAQQETPLREMQRCGKGCFGL